MIDKRRSILRLGLVILYITIIVICVAGISLLFSYFNTGADRSTMLHSGSDVTINYRPSITWQPLRNEGKKMNEQTLKDIESDYLSSWYVQHIALQTNDVSGVDMFYTSSAQRPLRDNITENATNNITIKETSLSHELELNFFSEDGQLVSITAHEVVLYKEFEKNSIRVGAHYEYNSYDIVMLKEDGYWRVRHRILTSSKPKENRPIIETSVGLKLISGMNYYPKDHPWDMFGVNFNPEVIKEDFNILNKYRINAIRIFIPYQAIGAHNISEIYLSQIDTLLELAHEQKLQVIVTLFDFYGDYSVQQWSLNHRYLEAIVNRIKDIPSLVAWDIKNEPDLDFDSRGKLLINAWLNEMVYYVKSIDPNTPVTVGWSSGFAAQPDVTQDFVSFHYYKDPDLLRDEVAYLKSNFKNKTLVLEEYGKSSYGGIWNPLFSSESKQANYHKRMTRTIKSLNISSLSWTMYDFYEVPTTVVGRLPWRKIPQKKYGFFNAQGAPKKAIDYITILD